MKLKELVEELNLFERERVFIEIKNSWYSNIHPNFFDEEDR